MRMALFTRFTKCLEGGILHVVDLDLRAVDPSDQSGCWIQVSCKLSSHKGLYTPSEKRACN